MSNTLKSEHEMVVEELTAELEAIFEKRKAWSLRRKQVIANFIYRLRKPYNFLYYMMCSPPAILLFLVAWPFKKASGFVQEYHTTPVKGVTCN